jgi:2-polyprenyl-3-methyl-5-hydroxy-6-metoxy-1,4-benzoquinol methylase
MALPSLPLFRDAWGHLADYKFVHEPVAAMLEAAGSAYEARVESHLALLDTSLGRKPEAFADAVDGFVEMSFDVMRMQERFYRTGVFSAGPDDEGGDGLYTDPEVMGRRYLFGLYLAQVFWPNHLEKLQFFESAVLSRVRPDMSVLEVGTGPGTYGLSVGRSAPCRSLVLSDISPLSIEFARRMAEAAPVVNPAGLDFVTGDFLDIDPQEHRRCDLVLFSEVVEHLADPDRGMAMLADVLAADGFVFFSTATNAAFYDHTIIFESIDEIERLLASHAFEVVERHTALAAVGPEGRDVIDYNAVIRSRGAA